MCHELRTGGRRRFRAGGIRYGYRRPEVRKVVDERLVMRDNRIVTTNEAAATEMLRAALKEKCRMPASQF